MGAGRAPPKSSRETRARDRGSARARASREDRARTTSWLNVPTYARSPLDRRRRAGVAAERNLEQHLAVGQPDGAEPFVAPTHVDDAVGDRRRRVDGSLRSAASSAPCRCGARARRDACRTIRSARARRPATGDDFTSPPVLNVHSRLPSARRRRGRRRRGRRRTPPAADRRRRLADPAAGRVLPAQLACLEIEREQFAVARRRRRRRRRRSPPTTR